MKKLLLILSLLFFSVSVFAGGDSYQVLHVKGTIMVKASGKILKPGDMISSEDQLVFRGDAMAAVISPQKGRFVMKSGPAANANSEIVAYVKSSISPASSKLSTRKGLINNSLDLKKYFDEGKTPVVVTGKLAISVNASTFPLDNDHFFYIRYKYKGEDVNKQLEFQNDKFFVEKQTLFSVDGKPIAESDITGPLTLFYFHKEVSDPISVVQFSFPIPEELAQQIKMIKNANAGKSKKETLDEIYAFVSETYGTPDQEAIEVIYDGIK